MRLGGNSAIPNDPIQIILTKIKGQGIPLGGIAHINQGVVSGCDYVSKKNIKKIKINADIKQKDGIYVFDLNNPRDASVIESFTEDERKLLRPFFKNSDIERYWCKNEPSKLLLYLGKNTSTIDSFPNVKKHLSKYLEILNDRREVLNGRIKYYHLQWYRTENIFIEEKIIVPYRSEFNTFAYNNREWFCRSDSYVITHKDKAISLKYLLSLLNSKLYYLWLYHRGKRKGEMLELFQVPLSEIPIMKVSASKQWLFIEIVDKILAITQSADYLTNQLKISEVKKFESQIDHMVYKLYDLTPEEIKIVETSAR